MIHGLTPRTPVKLTGGHLDRGYDSRRLSLRRTPAGQSIKLQAAFLKAPFSAIWCSGHAWGAHVAVDL
jgi:hypothetical protein